MAEIEAVQLEIELVGGCLSDLLQLTQIESMTNGISDMQIAN